MSGSALPLAARRTDADVEAAAQALLRDLSQSFLTNPGPVPIADILQYDLDERFGIPFFVQDLHPEVMAVTQPASLGNVQIEMQPYIYDLLMRDQPRARFTAAHEVGHAVLHAYEVSVAMVNGRVSGLHRRNQVPYDQNPERQANRFAAAFLMPAAAIDAAIQHFGLNPGVIAGEFGVSYQAMTYRLRDLRRAW